MPDCFRGPGFPRSTPYTIWNDFRFSYHLDVNGERIVSGDQEPSKYTPQLREFIHAVRENRTPAASGEEIARTTMPLLDAARRSDLERRIVVLGEWPSFRESVPIETTGRF